MPTIENRFQFAQETILKAGSLALGYFKRFDSLEVMSKGVQDMASEADMATEKLIEDAVCGAYPMDVFLGEESADTFVLQKGKGTWIIDPVDGTQPFVNGIASWCVAIAYVDNERVEFGLVYDPNRDELFAARCGAGAWCNYKAPDDRRRLRREPTNARRCRVLQIQGARALTTQVYG